MGANLITEKQRKKIFFIEEITTKSPNNTDLQVGDLFQINVDVK